MVHVDIHDHLLTLDLKLQNFLVSHADLFGQLVNSLLQAVANLIVLEVSDPVKDILFGLLF